MKPKSALKTNSKSQAEQPIWIPQQNAFTDSNMAIFMRTVNAHHQTHLQHYHELYQWSIAYPEKFWPEVWKFCKIKATRLWDKVLINENQMPGAKWFNNAILNFAENLLSRHDDKLALIFVNENGHRQTLTYAELSAQVAKLAAALHNVGINANDRVVGFLPNMPEAIIGMLATTSIGAIWSSCSPDFGTHAIIDRFGQIQPKIMITTDGYFYNGKTYDNTTKIQEIQQQLPSINKTLIVPYLQKYPKIKNIPNAILFEDFLSQNSSLHFAQLPFDHPVYIMYSSGTTDVPKCIVHGAGGTLIQHLKELILHTNLTEKDIIFYYTTTGWMMWNWFITSLAVGATLVLYDGAVFHPTPNALFNLIDTEKVTIFGTSANYISACAKVGLTPRTTNQLTALRTILSTGSTLLPENFDYLYNDVKKDVQVSSISGGTDIISCFALGNPILPVYRGELQCIGLGLKVEVFNDAGKAIIKEKGELVCTAPFPSMPIYFWNDSSGERYHNAYFTKYPNVWAHGDFAEITEHGVVIYGRADAVLKPSGVRIGTAEIYREVEKITEIVESVAVGQEWNNNIRIILFVKLRDGLILTEELKNRIKTEIKINASPHHVPAKIIAIPAVPRTINGKIVEIAVREIINSRPVKNLDAIANAEVLEYYKNIEELKT